MKQLIAPIAILVAFNVFFVVVDGKEFNCYDDVQAVHRKSVEFKADHAEGSFFFKEKSGLISKLAKPPPIADISKSSIIVASGLVPEGTNNAENETTEERRTEDKLTETVVIAKSSIENNLVPFVVPVLTPEKAEIANNEALAFKERQENKAIKAENTIPALPTAVPVLTKQDAEIANKKALRSHDYKVMMDQALILLQKIENMPSILSLFIALIPLLFVCDIFAFRKRKTAKESKRGIRFTLERRFFALSSVVLLAFGFIIFVPWSVYFGNSVQFPFIFHDFLSRNLLLLTLSVCVVTTLLLLIPPIIGDYLIAIVAGLGLCVYCQSMFMNCFLGSMDSVEPKWGEHSLWGIVNISIWIILVAAPIAIKNLVLCMA